MDFWHFMRERLLYFTVLPVGIAAIALCILVIWARGAPILGPGY
jgi:hypothetical protein